MALICAKHNTQFEFAKTGKGGASVMRCPECVAQARAKVRLERDRFLLWHPYSPKVKNGIRVDDLRCTVA